MSASTMESIPLLSTTNDSLYGNNKSKYKIILIVTIFILITCLSLFLYNYKEPLTYKESYLSQSIELNYCKTSCMNSCSSYDSIYGKLCCDWIKDSNGGQSCSLQVSASGTCICSNLDTNTNNHDILIPVQAPIMTPPSITLDSKPTLKPSHKNKNDDDFGFLPWLPWDPIEIPVDSTPCLKQCKNPCGISQLNNKSYCCETNSKGTCSTTQINGKCYCN